MTDPMPASAELTEWLFRRAAEVSWAPVRLPHDAMLHEERTPQARGGADVAYFPGGRYVYRTGFTAPDQFEGGAALRFEGVQGHATVTVNGITVGQVRSGYTEFELALDGAVRWGAENEIVVVVDNSEQPSSRWYPGSGLFRPVRVVYRPSTRLATDGLRVRTRTLRSQAADVDVVARVTGPRTADAQVTVDLYEDGTVVASATGTGDNEGALRLEVPNARLWSHESPFLYELVVRVEVDGATVEERRERVGLRTIDLDSQRGLRINGRTVLLRGACIHHDNGPLGAATHRAAEFRRVRLLKQAGFNAIRSAHNPMSRHLLDACDELGMYVLDELADYWFVSKTAHDAAPTFRDTWREDAERLVEKDRNRASVIMYASGNEIPETATPDGVALSQEITDYLHLLDPDRPVTLAVNLFLNTLVTLNQSPYKPRKDPSDVSLAGSTEANVWINQIGRMMDLVSRLPQADRASRDAFATVDVAGYNYGLGRYDRDVRAYPDRVILGSETLPGDVARAWHLVEKHGAVIGDFVWAGWEYLGEAGVAVWVPGRRAGLSKPYPYVIAGPGMFDLVGQPDITLRLAQAAWGVLGAPAIGVRPLDRSGLPMVRSAWRRSDAVESWAWRGHEGTRAEIEVYSDADEIRLLLDGHQIGRRRAGRRRNYLARFTTTYLPGVLEAVAYRAGIEVSRSSLRSTTGPLALSLTTDSASILTAGEDLVFAEITISDERGTVEMLADEKVRVSVAGPGELIGLGTAAPQTTEAFTGDECTTFRGRALAIIRWTGGTGQIAVSATAERLPGAALTVDAPA